MSSSPNSLTKAPFGDTEASAPGRRHIRKVAILVDLSASLGRSILEGIIDYCSQESEKWELLTQDWGDLGDEESVSPAHIDGVISGNPLDPRARLWREARIPFVKIAQGNDPSVPSVFTDLGACAKLAAQHFLSRGLRNLAFLGESGSPSSLTMQRIYEDTVRDCGLQFFSHSTSRIWSEHRIQEHTALVSWLSTLTQPAGVFAASDILARRLSLCCRQLNLKIPSQLALLGMGDNELISKLSNPPLSSIIQSPYQIGWEAAKLLKGTLSGATSEQHLLIAPKGIVVRESSSQAVVAGDPLVLQSLEFIREHLQEGLHVDDVARAVSVSRRWLEQVFHKNLGRAPAAEIRRVQLENATRLLLESDWPLRVIARHCGLNSPERLSTLFRREMGISPGRFREKKQFT